MRDPRLGVLLEKAKRFFFWKAFGVLLFCFSLNHVFFQTFCFMKSWYRIFSRGFWSGQHLIGLASGVVFDVQWYDKITKTRLWCSKAKYPNKTPIDFWIKQVENEHSRVSLIDFRKHVEREMSMRCFWTGQRGCSDVHWGERLGGLLELRSFAASKEGLAEQLAFCEKDTRHRLRARDSESLLVNKGLLQAAIYCFQRKQ